MRTVQEFATEWRLGFVAVVFVLSVASGAAACVDNAENALADAVDNVPADVASNLAGHLADGQTPADIDDTGESTTADEMDVGPHGPTFLKVISFNVLCSICDREGYHPWAERLAEIQQIIAEYDADLVGIQELVWAQEEQNEVNELMALHSDYTAIYYQGQGNGLYESFSAWPDSTIYFRSSRFQHIESGSFWLSPTPDEPYSSGFAGTAFPRLMVWAKLHDMESGKDLLFANSHFDPNTPSQALSVPLVFDRLGDMIASTPTFMAGDFNSNPGSEAYGLLTDANRDTQWGLTDSYDVALDIEVRHSDGDETPWAAESRIDHIFFRGDSVTVAHWLVDLRKYGAPPLYPSDHRLMMATFEY